MRLRLVYLVMSGMDRDSAWNECYPGRPNNFEEEARLVNGLELVDVYSSKLTVTKDSLIERITERINASDIQDRDLVNMGDLLCRMKDGWLVPTKNQNENINVTIKASIDALSSVKMLEASLGENSIL